MAETTATAGTSCLDDLLAPLPAAEFLARFWGQSFVHVPGAADKFSALLPWSRLNDLLAYHRLKPPCLQLFQAGQEIDPKKYLEPREGREPHLRVAALTNLLAQGATLSLDEVDDLVPSVRALAVGLERIFRIRVQANLYASWRQDPGFDLHYDDHDTLILQVAGRKRWEIFRPTNPDPVRRAPQAGPRPTEPPVWSGLLEQGGLFFIPRGWWHVATPIETPSLHLSIGFANPTGLDLLHWLVGRMKASAVARKDLPHLKGADEQAAYVEELGKLLREAWSPDVIDRFMADADGRALPRPQAQLPDAALPQGLAIDESSHVRLASPRRLDLSARPHDGVFTFQCFGESLQCSEAILPALIALNDGEVHAVRDLCARAAGPAGSFAVLGFLWALALKGVITPAEGSAR